MRTVYQYDFYNTSDRNFMSAGGFESACDAILQANADHESFQSHFGHAEFYEISLRKSGNGWREVSRKEIFPLFPPLQF